MPSIPPAHDNPHTKTGRAGDGQAPIKPARRSPLSLPAAIRLSHESAAWSDVTVFELTTTTARVLHSRSLRAQTSLVLRLPRSRGGSVELTCIAVRSRALRGGVHAINLILTGCGGKPLGEDELGRIRAAILI